MSFIGIHLFSNLLKFTTKIDDSGLIKEAVIPSVECNASLESSLSPPSKSQSPILYLQPDSSRRPYQLSPIDFETPDLSFVEDVLRPVGEVEEAQIEQAQNTQKCK